ncbi:hypothetical protein DPMN_041957 [Dreissena polymorpha]|uniref:Uncharacterized protein n=1 Tax=Dreissena polymorpha TaxID=45954 RepID=A0A9D4HWH8_DREPO|nr:hypothetical protein DPMN_041957 [Dreissena polymorpha]
MYTAKKRRWGATATENSPSSPDVSDDEAAPRSRASPMQQKQREPMASTSWEGQPSYLGALTKDPHLSKCRVQLSRLPRVPSSHAASDNDSD